MGILDWVKKQTRLRLIERVSVFLLLFLLPTQFGKHFFFDFSYVNGVKIDYLSLVLYSTDILALFLLFLYHRSFFRHLSRYKTVFFTVVFFFSVNVLQSREPILSLYAIAKFMEMYFLFFLFRYRKTPVTFIATPLLLGALFQLILVMMQFINRHSIQGLFYFFGERVISVATPGIAKTSFLGEQILRPYGTFSHPNSMAGFFLLIYAFCLFIQRRKLRFQTSLVIYGLLALSSMLIFISFSKAAIATYLIITLIFFVRHGRHSKDRCLICDIAKFSIPITVAFVFLQGQMDINSIESRLYLLQQSFQMMADTFLLGTGFNQYFYLQSTYPSPYSYFFLQPVHNIFMLFFVQTGVIFSLFVSYFAIWFIKRYYKVMGGLFLAIIITGSFDHYWITLQQNMFLMAIIFGYASHLVERPEIEVREKK